jgi:hypothetical protein
MCWTMTKWFLRSIDASSRQALRMHAPEYQEIHCQSREIHVAGMKSALIRATLNWLESMYRAGKATKIERRTN